MTILGIIPARIGSKGVPSKNIKMLNGHPLIAYTIKDALAANYLDKIVVSTDSMDIVEIAQEYGIVVDELRPKELAEDNTPMLPVIQYVLKSLFEKGETFDAICLLQPTSPVRPNFLIDRSIAAFKKKNVDSLVTVKPVPHEYNPHWVFFEEEGCMRIATGEREIITRRQNLPSAYHRDGAIYLTKSSIVLKENSLYGNKFAGYINEEETFNIDTASDWDQAEHYIKYKKLLEF